MKVIVTGAGQLAWELKRTVPQGVECIALPRAELDITNNDQVKACFAALNPSAVINAAAHTAVDKAESDRDQAFAVNSRGPELLARQCSQMNAYFLHVSTDFVFDGSASKPYKTDSKKAPLGVYGSSKSDGEDAIQRQMQDNWAILRTAWVYSSHGQNFVKTMLRLMKDKPALRVVGDQVGTPTWAKGLAQVCWAAVAKSAQGVFHWTDAGVASWYDFAVAIQTQGLKRGLLAEEIPIESIPSEAYPTPAKRPSYSVLDKSKAIDVLSLESVHWQAQLACMMDELV